MENVLKRAKDGYYRNKTGVPARPTEPMKPTFNTPEKIAHYHKIMTSFKEELDRYQDALSQFNDRCQNMENQFRADLENDYKMTDHPKRDVIFKLAMERGRFSGKDTVVYAYIELLELLR